MQKIARYKVLKKSGMQGLGSRLSSNGIPRSRMLCVRGSSRQVNPFQRKKSILHDAYYNARTSSPFRGLQYKTRHGYTIYRNSA